MSKAYNPKTGQYEVEREQFDDLAEKRLKGRVSFEAQVEKIGHQQVESGADEPLPLDEWHRIAQEDRSAWPARNVRQLIDRVRQLESAKPVEQAGQRAGVADGWKLVPVELTDEMRQAAYDAFIAQSKKRNGLVEAYRAAIAAAPTPAAQEGEQP